MSHRGKPIVNPQVILREEFDDWAILFDPVSCMGYGLNPVGVFIWKRLDGRHSEEEILLDLKSHCENVPGDAGIHLVEFIDDLVRRGLAGYEVTLT
ncbi:MAG: SynChlorMet cassette protein ScmD [Desulfomonile sp.]|nr:SynChlorMet cassette protein ScmD [Desulfomonile sp.]